MTIIEETITTLSEIFTPDDHKRIIERYARMMRGEIKTTLTQEKLVEKSRWHVSQYLAKTGELPS